MSSHSQLNIPPIILFHYPFSPWSGKVRTYLTLRRIPHIRCEQPVTLPRPTMAALGLQYRRIPVMAIGRDIYCDSLLMLQKLDELVPPSEEYPPISAAQRNGSDLKRVDSVQGRSNGHSNGAGGNNDAAMEYMLEKWTDVVVFGRAAEVIPPSLYEGIPGFIKDRENLWGRSWSAEEQNKRRPEALANLRANMEFLERVLLADGREWVLGGEGPSLSDIHGAWIFQWLFDLEGAMPSSTFPKEDFQKTFAWFERYKAAIEKATSTAPKAQEMNDEEATKSIESSAFAEKDGGVDSKDPHPLKAGEQVSMWPIDTGFEYRETGKLVTLNSQESAVMSKTENGVEVRIHHPRWQFRIEGNSKSEDGLAAHGGDEGLGAEHYEERH